MRGEYIIILIQINCNSNSLNSSKFLKKLYEDKLNIPNLICPNCNSKSLKYHGKYHRSFICFESNEKIEDFIEIKRVKCESCGKTHSLIPEMIVPYKQYSLNYIISVIIQVENKSKKSISRKLSVTRSLIYTWCNIFLKHIPRLETSKLSLNDFLLRRFFADFKYCKDHSIRIFGNYKINNHKFT